MQDAVLQRGVELVDLVVYLDEDSVSTVAKLKGTIRQKSGFVVHYR